MLRILETEEADAVLAHELGHFLGGDAENRAALGPKLAEYDEYAGRMRHRILTLVASLLLDAYRLVFELAISRASREREFAADAVASRSTSRRALAHALVKTAAYAAYRSEVESALLELRDRHDGPIGIAGRIAAGLPAFTRSELFASLLADARAPHPFDSHPSLRERLERAEARIEAAEFAEIACARPQTSWADAIEDADGIEQRLWQEFEADFAKLHEEVLAYRYEPANDAERELVLRYFPDLQFALKHGHTIGVGYAGLALPEAAGTIAWDEVYALRYDDAIAGSDRLTIEHPEKGWLGRRKTVVRLAFARGQSAAFTEAVGSYWHRHQVMRSQAPSQEAAASA
jgi:hypothetical protein